jgi:hypothetical protein
VPEHGCDTWEGQPCSTVDGMHSRGLITSNCWKYDCQDCTHSCLHQTPAARNFSPSTACRPVGSPPPHISDLTHHTCLIYFLKVMCQISLMRITPLSISDLNLSLIIFPTTHSFTRSHSV